MSADTCISLASAFIAVCALCLSIWQMCATRKHDRLSVMPHLLITLQSNETPPGFEISLENSGIGPAVVSSYKVFLDGKRLEHFEHTAWLAIIDLLELKGDVIGMEIDAGEYFQTGKKTVLLSFKSKDPTLTLRQIRQVLQRLKVEIGYSSVYGDRKSARFEVPLSIFDCYDTDDGKI